MRIFAFGELCGGRSRAGQAFPVSGRGPLHFFFSDSARARARARASLGAGVRVRLSTQPRAVRSLNRLAREHRINITAVPGLSIVVLTDADSMCVRVCAPASV